MGYNGHGKRRKPRYKKPKEGGGKRVTVYLKGRSLDMARQIDNLSAFVQLALDQAPGVMTWAILKERQPEKYYDTVKLDDVLPEFNEAYPLDPLTAARKQKWQQNSAQPRELW